MTNREQIYNWLIAGLEQPSNRLSEIFYFDKLDNEFFSILVTDYFLFDENLNVAKNTTSTYSNENLEVLVERIRRVDDKDPSIISLPRLGNANGKTDKEVILQEVDRFIKLNAIDIDAATIWEVEEGGEIKIDLKIVDDSSRNNIK